MREYPYKHSTGTNFSVASYCLKMNHIATGAKNAYPYTNEEAVSTDWKLYSLQEIKLSNDKHTIN